LAYAVHQLDAGDRVRAFLNALRPSLKAMRCLTPRWSCSIKSRKYFDERSFVSVGSEPSAFSWRTARGDAAQPSSVIAFGARCWLLIDHFSKEFL
jgi:hypothetical protein